MTGAGGAAATAARPWRGLALLVLAASLLLYAGLWRGGPEWGGDTPSYLEAATDLADLRWDRLHFRTPGYPLFLRIVDGRGAPGPRLVAAQLVLYGVAVWSLASLLARLEVGRTAVVAFVAACSLPHVAQAADLALSESLAQSLLMLGFSALARGAFLGGGWGWSLAGSAALGYLAITRPVYQATAPTLAATLALLAWLPAVRPLRSAVRRTVVLAPAGTLLLAGGLAVYQQARFGAAASAAGTIALAGQTAAYVESLPPKEPLREILLRHRDAHLVVARHHRPEGYIFRAWPELVAHFDGDERRATREVGRLNREVIRREPRAYLLQVWRSLARYWEWCSFAVPGLRSPWIAAPLLLAHLAGSAAFASVVAVAGVAGLGLGTLPPSARARWRELAPPAPQLGVFLLAATTVLLHMILQCALAVGDARYRLPSEPLAFIAIVLGISMLCRLRRQLIEKSAGARS